MKTWAIGTLLFPALLAPLSWDNLEEGHSFSLTQKITLGEAGPSFPEGTILTMDSKEPMAIPGEPLMLYKLTETPCAHPEWESQMEIILPSGNEEASSVGVELAKDCQWNVYVEAKDLFTPSFFAGAK